MDKVLVKNLHQIAGGLNIEGGFPYYDLIKNSNQDKIWANIIAVLDRPLIDQILFEELDQLMKKNSYKLLENTINDLNEHQFLSVYFMVIGYYLENGRHLLKKKKNDILDITIHIHQDKNAQHLINIIKQHISDLFDYFDIDKQLNKIEFRTDDPIYIATKHSYQQTDILLSFSQCAGLEPTFNPGTILIADQFIPLDIENKIIFLNQKYQVSNDIIIRLKDILNSKYHSYAISYINKNYQSDNLSKNNFTAKKLSLNDFHLTKIVQVNQLWNPTNENEELIIDLSENID